MDILLDTHTFLWFSEYEGSELPKSLREKIRDTKNKIFVSIASLWEIIIKNQTGKLNLPVPLETLVDGAMESGIKILTVRPEHVYTIKQLSLHHRDPFDRMIIAQCITDNLTIASIDKNFPLYPVSIIWN